ncbi:pilus assembly protein [Streptomyces griseoviridis]|uniref:pilus assembly protein n=1 Tax=Streptomyces griseoviridis TaxID=45398 RepID=UPI0033CC63D9
MRRPPGGTRERRDGGQVTIEFLGMTPTILVTLVVLWQLVLVGYTFTLAGNAADEAVRAGTAAEGDAQGACRRKGERTLPSAWQRTVTCGPGAAGYFTADVRLKVPVLFPGTVDFPFRVHGHAGAVQEARR